MQKPLCVVPMTDSSSWRRSKPNTRIARWSELLLFPWQLILWQLGRTIPKLHIDCMQTKSCGSCWVIGFTHRLNLAVYYGYERRYKSEILNLYIRCLCRFFWNEILLSPSCSALTFRCAVFVQLRAHGLSCIVRTKRSRRWPVSPTAPANTPVIQTSGWTLCLIMI